MRGKRIFLYDKRICFDSTVGPIHSVQLAIPEPTMEYATGKITFVFFFFFLLQIGGYIF